MKPPSYWVRRVLKPKGKGALLLRDLLAAAFIIVAMFGSPVACVYLFAGPMNQQPHMVTQGWVMQARGLGMALWSYSHVENKDVYPDGASSTEVFQKLLDAGYVSDPGYFYVPMPGKVKAAPNQRTLKPENVCFDVTGGVGEKDSGQVPVVFLTGFRVTYAPGAAARPLNGGFPTYETKQRLLFFSWGDSWQDEGNMPGVAVFYKGNEMKWLRAQDGAIPDFIPASFDAHGKTYRQLTPDGVLR